MGKRVQRNKSEKAMSKHTLPESVFGKTERLLADAEYGHVAQELEVHAPLQIAAHVGDTEKAYQVIFAIVDDGENLFAAGRRQATINLLDSSASGGPQSYRVFPDSSPFRGRGCRAGRQSSR